MSSNVPSNWIGCPEISEIIAGKFFAFKTPLEYEKFSYNLRKTDIFTPRHIFNVTKNLNVSVINCLASVF